MEMGFIKKTKEMINKLLNVKDKKNVNKLCIILFTGITLLISSTLLFDKKTITPKMEKQKQEAQAETTQSEKTNLKTPDIEYSYEKDLELRLSNALGLVDGAGSVKVMLTVSKTKEVTVAMDRDESSSITNEKDNGGGTREIDVSESKQSTVILRKSDGSENALILSEEMPKVEGVIIISEGGNRIEVKDALVRAATAVLGIESHKVQVFQMKTN